MAGPDRDASCQGDVRKLVMFEKLGASSPPGTYTPVIFMGQNDFGGSVATGGASVDRGQSVPCNECSKSHPPYSLCPYIPCYICDKVHLDTDRCPYFRQFPKGAACPPGYEIVCQCGYDFDEDKWACSYCDWTIPMLKAKFCSICNSGYEHSEYDCPKDTNYKLARDRMLSSRVRIPHRPVVNPESSSGIPHVPTTPDMDPGYILESSSGTTYSPTAPSWVCGDMRETKDMNKGKPCYKIVSWTL